MKHFTKLLVVVLLFATTGLMAQTIYTDDFESYTTGQGVADQDATDTWTTWSGTTGDVEDPLVTDAAAHAGTQAMVIEGSNDAVLLLNDLTENRYRVEFYLMVPTDFVGYYNILQNFNGSSSTWGMQLFFKDGTCTIDGNGEAEVTYSYTPGEWMKIQHFIDLDNDWIDFYINGELVHAYQWSHGTFNDGTGINKLDAFNFFAWNDDGNGTPKLYMDDYIIEQVAIPNPPQNLVATVDGGDVNLTWEAPIEGTPDTYSIIRDGEEIATVESTVFTYDDLDLYPMNYNYEIKAYYGESIGYSASAGPEVANIAGGVIRNATLMEVHTGTWCSNCPAIAVAAEDFNETDASVAIIEYHNGDDFVITADATRETYYGITGFPTTIMDGEEIIGGGGAASLAPDMLLVMEYYQDIKIDVPSCANLSVNVNQTDAVTYDLDITAEETFAYFGNDLSLHVVVTESNIAESWQGLTVLDFVVRSMLPDGNGTSVDFSGNTTQNFTQQVVLDPSWVLGECELIVFLQDNTTKTIMQTAKIEMDQFVSITDETLDKVAVFPNPANDILNITADNNIETVELVNLAGQSVLHQLVNGNNHSIDVSDLSEGVYMIRINTTNRSMTKKLILN